MKVVMIRIGKVFFSSNGSGTGFQEEDWRACLADFIPPAPMVP